MGKSSGNSTNNNAATTTPATKVKRTRKSVPRDSPPQRSSIYRGVTRLDTKNDCVIECSVSFFLFHFFLFIYRRWRIENIGIGGPDVMKLTCGIRIAGMRLRTRREDKVNSSSSPSFFLFFFSPKFYIYSFIL